MGGSYRGGCRVSRLEDQCKQRVGGLEKEVGKGQGVREPIRPFLFVGGNAERSVTLCVTQLSLTQSSLGVCAQTSPRLWENNLEVLGQLFRGNNSH